MKKLLVYILIMSLAGVAYGQDGSASLVDIQQATALIREKERELTAKEQELNAKEARLNLLEQDLIVREENLRRIRDEINSKMNMMRAQNDEELDKLAKLYASTKPKQAASVIVNMDLDKSAALMTRISAMTAGRIMAEIAKMDPDYASRLTSRMAGEEINVDDILAGPEIIIVR